MNEELINLKLQVLESALSDLKIMEAAWGNVVKSCSLFERLSHIEGESCGLPEIRIPNQIDDLGQRIYTERQNLLRSVKE